MRTDQTCVVGIRCSGGRTVKAFDMRIRGEEVYTNYCDISTPEAHASYHKSGQYHIKVGKKYIEWTGGLTRQMEPMKIFKLPPVEVRDRCQCWVVGWYISKLHVVLPPLTGKRDFVVDAAHLDPEHILGFEAYIVGPDAKKQTAIVGYPVMASHRFGYPLGIEICSFVVS